jgi:hypothetical protein
MIHGKRRDARIQSYLDLKRDEVVTVTTSYYTGKGKVCGKATIAQPIIGEGVIVEMLDNHTLPFSHAVFFENTLQRIK